MDDVLTRVEAVRAVIEQHREASDALGRLAPAIVEELRAQRLYSLVLPASLGGLGASARAALEAVEALARIDAPTAWNVNQAGGGALVASRLGAEGRARLFANHTEPPTFAGAGSPMCVAKPAEGGYEVTGMLRFVSGVHDADWVFATAAVPNPDGGPAPADVLMVFVPRAEVEILDTWHVMGMKGTGSCDVAFPSVRVPEMLAASMMRPAVPAPEYEGTAAAVSPWPVILGEAVVSLGIAEAAQAIGRDVALRKVPTHAQTEAANRESVQASLARARALTESARAYMYSTIDKAQAWVDGGQPLSPDHKVSLQLAACTAAENGARAVDLVYDALGTAGFQEAVGLERHVRDARVLTQHGTKSSPRFASAGKVMLGLPPDVPLLR